MLQEIRSFASQATAKIRAFLRTLTKSKVHRYLHVAGTLCALASMVAVWFMKRFASSDAVIADCLIFVTYLTRWQVVLTKIDNVVVDRLPIPDGDELPTPKIEPVSGLSGDPGER